MASSNAPIHADEFDWIADNGSEWLRSGASLLRSARLLARENANDRARYPKGDTGMSKAVESAGAVRYWPAAVYPQALMLAAMAVECALKAVIAETDGMTEEGKLAFEAGERPHDLVALAKRAGIVTKGEVETQAIDDGLDFIAWMGRFPTPTRAEYAKSVWLDVPNRVAAYERIFRRAWDKTAREQYARRPNARHGTTLEEHMAHARGLLEDLLAES